MLPKIVSDLIIEAACEYNDGYVQQGCLNELRNIRDLCDKVLSENNKQKTTSRE